MTESEQDLQTTLERITEASNEMVMWIKFGENESPDNIQYSKRTVYDTGWNKIKTVRETKSNNIETYK